jgi:hypothetical protein
MSNPKTIESGQPPLAGAIGSESGRVEHFRFNLNDRVIILEIQRPGKVEALMIDYIGVQYQVAYWDNSKRETTWLHADELDIR